MNRSNILRHFLDLIAIDSPSGCEEAVRQKLIAVFSELGCRCDTDRAGNLKCLHPGTEDRPVRLFAAHMDTVEPGRGICPILEKNGIIRSDGTTILGADDKDGIAVLWSALEHLRKSGTPHGPLEFLFTVGEEQNLGGSSRIRSGWLLAKAGWILDGPGRPGVLYADGVGKRGFRLTVRGRAAHSGICPEKGINAMMLTADCMRRFPPGHHGNATVNYGTIRGGTADNIVPANVFLTGEIRSSSASCLKELWEELESVWQPVAGIEETAGYPAYALPPDAQLITATFRQLQRLGLNPQVLPFKAGCDANYLSRLGIEVCTLAMGRKDNHTVQEQTRISNLEIMTEAVHALMTEADLLSPEGHACASR